MVEGVPDFRTQAASRQVNGYMSFILPWPLRYMVVNTVKTCAAIYWLEDEVS